MSFSGNTLAEVAEDEFFRVGGLEVSLEVELGEGLLQEVEHDGSVGLEVFEGHQSVSVDSFTFVNPKLHEFVRSLELSRLGHQESLEHTGDVSKIELVVEVQGSLSECGADGRVKSEGALDQSGHLF